MRVSITINHGRRPTAWPASRITASAVLVLLALFAAACAFAGDVAYLKSESGSEITFTNVPCKEGDPSSLVAHTAAKSGKVLFGCWFVSGRYVMVEWQDGDTYRYRITDLTPGPVLADKPAIGI